MATNRPAYFDARLLSYRPMLVRMATRFAEPADREDLVQSAFARAMEKWTDCREGFAVWLRYIMLAEIQNYRAGRRPVSSAPANDNVPATQDIILEAKQALGRCRHPEIMIEIGMGSSMQEIAESCGLTKQAISLKVIADRKRLNSRRRRKAA
ncbi:sigma-70 family RNA polymerase sigma factor [Rhizobium daejeonense]|uniref:Sigma-70 family RNA polymerase sigma factor n=1 Tax=Rhizobium daejeonense TaxID=240521 RepID=A0A6M1RRH3_9HYPH|nr:sigma-70 family RNA polymerase sigma factor [Rhizobium daejeonense]NGO63932.1 sigma-70 family RNA polymerase sigma factor [Rhizobium daejeonense]